MQSIFELKKNLPYDRAILEKMQETAEELLRDAKHGQYTQAIVVYSARGREYSALLHNACSLCDSGEDTLLNALRSAGDTEIRYVLTTWQDGGIDLPSHAFRSMLIALNPANADALLFVMTAGGVSVMKASATMQ